MYKSPITIQDYPDIVTQTQKMMKDLQDKSEDYIMTRVIKTLGVEVDKEELIKALRYDRDQYAVGFQEGYHSRDEKIVRCKDCYFYDTKRGDLLRKYEGFCYMYHCIKNEDGFCNVGIARKERRETE